MDDASNWSHFGTLRTYQPGDYIFREGDPGDSTFVIKSGRVAILKDDKDGDQALALGYREAGRLLGEVSLLQETPRTASVQAVEVSELYVIPRDVFWQQLESDAEFRWLVMRTLISHLLVADQGRIDAAAAQRALSKVIQLRQDMTNFIVHDLQNPLGIMRTAVSEIQKSPGYDSASESAALIGMAGDAADRMQTLVTSLLDTERLKHADARIDVTEFSMATLITEVVERNQPLATHKSVRLAAASFPADLPRVEADRLRIDRTLTNLVDNALKFTPRNGKITVTAWHEQGWVVVAVNDTGPGIPEDNRDQVFLRFVQGDTGEKSKRGFGLGLAFCLATINIHNGRIWVEDGEGGVGSKFVFSLPVKAAGKAV